MLLAGDIGGTHTRLALFEKGKIASEEIFSSRNYSSLEEIAQAFLRKKKSIAKACFGIAGPVCEGKCRATNLPWFVDAARLSQELHIPSVFLLNDLEANAYGLQVLKEGELHSLNRGAKKQKGNQALISAGTGLGEAGLFWDGKEHRPFAGEGGHVDFAPRDEDEAELFFYLKKRHKRVSYERVISGPGLYTLYQFLVETGREKGSSQIEAERAQGKDPSAVISQLALSQKDKGCVRAVNWFVSLFGAEAGNLALKFLALGGVFIGGGIAPILLEVFKKGDFFSSFIDKGRFKELLESIPIWLILNDSTALLGAAFYAEKNL